MRRTSKNARACLCQNRDERIRRTEIDADDRTERALGGLRMRLRIRLSRVLRVRALHRARDGTGNGTLEKELRRAKPTGVGCLG